MFWFPGPPYCAVAAFNKWSSVYLYLPVWVCASEFVCFFMGVTHLSALLAWCHIQRFLLPADTTQHNWSPAITFTPSGIWGMKLTLRNRGGLDSFPLTYRCVCVCVCLIHSFSCGHDGGCLLQVSQWCSSIAAPEGSLTGRQRAQWAPHPPPGSIWLGWRVPAPEPLSQAWMDLAYLYSHSVTQGDPNLTMPLWLCPATLYLCVRLGVCVSERASFVLFNRRACSCCVVAAQEFTLCVFLKRAQVYKYVCIYLCVAGCVCVCVPNLPLRWVVTQSSAFIFLS